MWSYSLSYWGNFKKKYEDLIEKVKDMNHVKKYVAEECDLLKRIKKAHELYEEYMKSIEKN